jgi:hypothetical protein
VTVYASIADPGYDPLAVAPFYLSDIAYVTVGSHQGIMGVFHHGGGTSARSVRWRSGGVDIELSSYGLEAHQLLDLAARASTRADRAWTERQWEAAEDGDFPFDESQPVLVEQALDFGDGGGGALMATRFGSALSWWIDQSTRLDIGRYGQPAAPVVLQVATNPVPATETDRATHVVAMVLGDASIDGATLQLRVGALVSGAAEGSEQMSGAPLHPLNGGDDATTAVPTEFGYTHGVALALPWTEGGFVAELIAADGITVLATATPADLG